MRHAVRWAITALAGIAALVVTVSGQDYYRSGGGVTSPVTSAVVQGGSGTTSTLTLQPTSGIGTTGADIVFKGGNNGATELGRWTNAGTLQSSAISIDSGVTALAGSGVKFLTATDTSAGDPAAFVAYGAVATGANNWYFKTRAATTAPTTIVQSGDRTMSLIGAGADGTNYIIDTLIRSEIDGTPGTNNMPGRITFWTNGGSASVTERWRIASGGGLLASADNSWDIGAAGATRPRTVYAGTSVIAPLHQSTTAKVLFQGTGSGATQLATTQTTAPTCTTNCGTSPSVAGTDTFMTVTMGASGVPASGWVVTFNGTWAAAPACHVQMGLAGMVVGKMPLTVATTTTTITVVTNGTAPSTSDKYHIQCGGLQ